MSTPQSMLEDQSITRPPYSKGQQRSLWIKRMKDLLQDDEDEMAIKFKKVKENSKKKNSDKPKNSDQEQQTGCFECEQKQNQSRSSNGEQFSGCFKCGKLDHIVKHCPQRKKEQEAESPKK